jgi:hypothetical protein
MSAVFTAHKDSNNDLVLHGEDHVLWHDVFDGRDKHLVYVSLTQTKTLCVAYSFKCVTVESIGVMWGACIMSHRKGSPPKQLLRSTARERVKKCPAHQILPNDDFGANLESGKAHFRKNLFKELVRTYGVRGARIDRM